LNAAERRQLEAMVAHVGVPVRVLGQRVAMARASQQRYDAARKHMVEANLRLAFHMARKLSGNGVSFEDLVQEAILGLMRAAEKFDPSLGYKFSTYASQWIWQGITRAVADGSRTIRVAAHMHDTIIRLNRLSRTLQQDLGRDPTLSELAQRSGLPEPKVRKALDSSRHPLSLDAPLQDFEDTSLGALIEDEGRTDPMDETFGQEVSSEVMQLLAVLPAREALILRLRHGIGVAEPYTLEEIGKVLGITRERTRQLEVRAMDRLRDVVDPQLVLALRV
ncbi:MAG: sigma-70 family RNA polymerase sigma factor, partial [Gammaproteobacteria bacterium]